MDRQAQIKADLEAYRASKQGVTSTLPVQKTGDIKADLEAYRASKQQPIAPIEQPKTEKDNNMFQKLFVNTVGRAGDSLARVIALGGAKVADTVGKKEYGDKLRNAALDPTPLAPLPVINATVEGQKAFGEGGGKQLAINTGKTALDIATIGEGGAINAGLKELGAKALPQLTKSKLGRGSISTVANVTEGVGYNTAYNALNEKPLTENAGIAGVASAVLPPVIKGVARIASKFTKRGALQGVEQEVDNLLRSNKSLTKKSTELQARGVNINEKLSDPEIFGGLKIENRRINPDEAISALDNKIDTAMEAKRALLPELDRFLPKVKKTTIRERAIQDIQDKFSPADELDIIRDIDRQIDALPDEFTLKDLDTLRARFRQSARDAKGLQKRASEYSALENAIRNELFDITDNLQIENLPILMCILRILSLQKDL